jgi:hypothetical protein
MVEQDVSWYIELLGNMLFCYETAFSGYKKEA